MVSTEPSVNSDLYEFNPERPPKAVAILDAGEFDDPELTFNTRQPLLRVKHGREEISYLEEG